MAKVVEVSSQNELDEVFATNRKVVVDFSRKEGCVWCKKLAPHFEAAAGLDTNTVFVVADVDEAPSFVSKYEFMSVPTVILFENGDKVAEVKARTALQIVSEIKR